jgi:hypothetical protein
MKRVAVVTLAVLVFGCHKTEQPPSSDSNSASSTVSAPVQTSSTSTSASTAVEAASTLQSYTSAKGAKIVIDIAPNQVVMSPLVLSGTAPGPWYFEAVFPIDLLDASGTGLEHSRAQAQSDAMTTAPVAFKASFTFNAPAGATGTLVLHNDNPSGLPENDDEVRIPIRFR